MHVLPAVQIAALKDELANKSSALGSSQAGANAMLEKLQHDFKALSTEAASASKALAACLHSQKLKCIVPAFADPVPCVCACRCCVHIQHTVQGAAAPAGG